MIFLSKLRNADGCKNKSWKQLESVFATLPTLKPSTRLAPKTKNSTPRKPVPATDTKNIIPKNAMSALKPKKYTFQS